MTRLLKLEGVDNFRDYGGYAARDGARIRTGRLWRSAAHGRATDDDLVHIDRLGLGVVFDLRTLTERTNDPSRRPEGFSGRVVHHDTDEVEDSLITHIGDGGLTAESCRRFMVHYYHQAPFNPRLTTLYSLYFAQLASEDTPVLIHCAAGKDRTGILAALTHYLLGVHADDIHHDYLLTNDPERFARRLPMVMEHLEASSGVTPDEEAVLTVMGVESEYLHTAFNRVAREHGDLDRYIETVLGVTAAQRAKIAERLLV